MEFIYFVFLINVQFFLSAVSSVIYALFSYRWACASVCSAWISLGRCHAAISGGGDKVRIL